MCPGDLNSTTNSVKWETGRINYQITEFPVIIISWPVPQACLRKTQRKDKDTREGEGRSNTGVVQVAAAFQTHTHTLTREHIRRCRQTHSHIWPVCLLCISGIEVCACTRLHVTASHLAGCMNKHGCLCSASSLQSASIRSEDDSKNCWLFSHSRHLRHVCPLLTGP